MIPPGNSFDKNARYDQMVGKGPAEFQTHVPYRRGPGKKGRGDL